MCLARPTPLTHPAWVLPCLCWGRGVPPAGPQAARWFLALQPAVGSGGCGQHQL